MLGGCLLTRTWFSAGTVLEGPSIIDSHSRHRQERPATFPSGTVRKNGRYCNSNARDEGRSAVPLRLQCHTILPRTEYLRRVGEDVLRTGQYITRCRCRNDAYAVSYLIRTTEAMQNPPLALCKHYRSAVVANSHSHYDYAIILDWTGLDFTVTWACGEAAGAFPAFSCSCCSKGYCGSLWLSWPS